MAKIPWWLWVAVGGGMFLISANVGERLDFFLYVGMFFIVVGVFKMLVAFILGKKGRKAEAAAEEIKTHQFSCPRCRSLIAESYYFCPYCGTRLR